MNDPYFLPARYGAVSVTVAVAVVVQFMIHFLRGQNKENVSLGHVLELG